MNKDTDAVYCRLSRRVSVRFSVPLVAMVTGVLAGLAFVLLHFQQHEGTALLEHIVSFNDHVFFLFLLPPIIFTGFVVHKYTDVL